MRTKNQKLVVISLITLYLGIACNADEKSPLDYVDPTIGTISTMINRGKTLPGSVTPFGMVQLGPDTITEGDYTSGYCWLHNSIEGFSFTHMSGTGWYGEFGNLMVMPTTGEKLRLVSGSPLSQRIGDGWRSWFKRNTEHAEVGRYSVLLGKYNIQAEASCTPRTGVLRFTYPQDDHARILIDLSRRVGGAATTQHLKMVDNQTIEGWMHCTPETGGMGHGRGGISYKLHFYMKFSRPLDRLGFHVTDFSGLPTRDLAWLGPDTYQTYIKRKGTTHFDQKEVTGDRVAFIGEFASKEKEQVMVKAGISYVSIEGARKNLEAETPHWDFERVVAENRQRWSDAFAENGLTVKGGTEEQKIVFYTGLYRTMIHPHMVSDVDGNYVGADHKVHQADGFDYRTVFSGWDVFRSQFPLQTIINPKMVHDEVNTLMAIAEQSGRGYYPQWELMNTYVPIMYGDAAISVVLDAWEKGIRTFDLEKAYAIARKTSLDGWRPNNEHYHAHGYMPGISWTLESNYFDWTVGRLAEILGKTEDAERFYGLAKMYRTSYDPEVQCMRSRNLDGSWAEWVSDTAMHNASKQGTIECSPLQQMWFVPHDIQGLEKVMGKEVCEKQLTRFFEGAHEDFGLGPYFNAENEHHHNAPYIWAYIGKPWMVQKWTRLALEKAFGTGPHGWPGNDDCGQISAWFILNAIGLHPACPGDPVYTLTSPLFNEITIGLDADYYPGKQFKVIAKNNSTENRYIQSARLNGKELNRFWISHAEIAAGGILEFEMGSEPNKEWATGPEALPPVSELYKNTKAHPTPLIHDDASNANGR